MKFKLILVNAVYIDVVHYLYHKEFGIRKLVEEFEKAIEDSKVYEKLRSGFQVLILGPPNTGKSSLLNYLGTYNYDITYYLSFWFVAKDYISIVSDQAGTTRDLVKHDLLLNGSPIKIIDTAGLRLSSCNIEAQGIKLAKRA